MMFRQTVQAVIGRRELPSFYQAYRRCCKQGHGPVLSTDHYDLF